jgi:hypothetical protein
MAEIAGDIGQRDINDEQVKISEQDSNATIASV